MYGVTKNISSSCVGVVCGYKVERERGNVVLKAHSSEAATVHSVLQGCEAK